ncbi:hypothetical protein V6N13_072979 [Hibiscus sabdariffa]
MFPSSLLMGLLSPRAMVQARNFLRKWVNRLVLKGCFKDGSVVICPGFGSRLLPFFILWICRLFYLVVVRRSALGFPSLSSSLVRRSLLSKAFQCLFLVVPTFTALGVNDGALGIVAKIAVLDPLSIQVNGFCFRPPSYAQTSTVSLTSMMTFLMFVCLSVFGASGALCFLDLFDLVCMIFLMV